MRLSFEAALVLKMRKRRTDRTGRTLGRGGTRDNKVKTEATRETEVLKEEYKSLTGSYL